DDGRIVLYRRERVDRLLIPNVEADVIERIESFDERHRTILERLGQRGASFHAELVAALPAHDANAVVDAIWDLVWAGLITNDTFAALRSLGVRARASRPKREARPLGIP